MRYRSEYPRCYEEGTVNKTFSISKPAFDLLNNNIENQSAFVNDLILDALQEKDFFKKRLMAQITNAQKELKEKYQVDVELKV
jgi:hypothetical protein